MGLTTLTAFSSISEARIAVDHVAASNVFNFFFYQTSS